MHKKNRKFIFPFFCLSVFLILFLVNFFSTGFKIDYLISKNISSLHKNNFNELFIFLGHYARVILIGLSVFFVSLLYLQKRKKKSLVLATSLILGLILEQVIKFFVQRERPLIQLVQEAGYSFPSGHAISSIILFSLLIYFYKNKIESYFFRIIFIFVNIFLILLVGFSRIYLNVHWLSDIIGGYALGLSIVYAVLIFYGIEIYK